MYAAYLKLYSLNSLDPKIPQTLFVVLHHKYSGSTLWSINSCVNSWYKVVHDIDLKSRLMVTSLMKTVTSNHIIKKAPTFSTEEMNCNFD